MQKLPTDILLLLVSDYIRNDLEALRATSLLCRDIQPFSQRYIFSKITIRITGGRSCQSKRVLEGLSLLSSSVFVHIKQLHLVNGDRGLSERARNAWYRNLGPILEGVLRKFLSEGTLEGLSINGIIGEVGVIQEATARQLIEQLCQCPSIRSLEFTKVPGELLFLPFSAQLKHLTARHMSLLTPASHSVTDELQDSTSVALESLSLHRDHVRGSPMEDPIRLLLSLMHTRICLTRLKHVSIYFIGREYISMLCNTFQACKGSLQSLDIKISGK